MAADRPALLSGLCCAALLLAGCAPDDGPGQDSVVAEIAVGDSFPATLVLLTESAEPAAPERFAHAPHRAIDCGTCHGRVPGHDAHADVACIECHPPPAASANLPRPGERDCLRCHHETSGLACTRCHASSGPPPRPVPVTLAIAGTPRTRALPFAHERHASEECRTCHETPPAFAFTQTCDGCHERHHTATAECTTCHSDANRMRHEAASAHRGCGGAGCHSDPLLPALAATRAGCLVCHPEQTAHEPARDCATCHLSAGPRP